MTFEAAIVPSPTKYWMGCHFDIERWTSVLFFDRAVRFSSQTPYFGRASCENRVNVKRPLAPAQPEAESVCISFTFFWDHGATGTHFAYNDQSQAEKTIRQTFRRTKRLLKAPATYELN